MDVTLLTNPGHIAAHVRRYIKQILVSGLAVALPFVAVYLVGRFIFLTLDGLLQPAVVSITGRSIPAAGVIVLLGILFILGLVFTTPFGRRAVETVQRLLVKLPLVGSPYGMAKQMFEFVSEAGQDGFKRVIAIQYPRPGLFSLGLVTGCLNEGTSNPLLVVFLPTSPTPNSGLLVLVPEAEVYETDITVLEALKMVVSCGTVSPQFLHWPERTPHELREPQVELLTVGEVSAQLNVHPNTVRRWAKNGSLDAVRMGPRQDRKFRRSDIARLVQLDVGGSKRPQTTEGTAEDPRALKLTSSQ